MKKRISIIGSGFSSLSAACYLAQLGHQVEIFEKNSTPGGRARQLKKDGFVFDIGPSWYWMPDVFEKFFGDFGKKVSDYYELERLDPGYQVYFGRNDSMLIGDSLEKIYAAFEAEEKGSANKLKKFIGKAADNYKIAINELVYRPRTITFGTSHPRYPQKIKLLFFEYKKRGDSRIQKPQTGSNPSVSSLVFGS